MTTPSVGAIATALQAALQTVTGLRTAPYLSDTISPPVALVAIDTVDYHGALSNADVEHVFTVLVIVGRASDRAGLASMEDYMSQAGASSIRAALEQDLTLGGVVSTLIVRKSGPPTSVGINGAEYISVPFTVEVHA